MLPDYTRPFEKDEIALAGLGGVDATAISLWDNKNDANTYNTNTYPQVLKTLARFVDIKPLKNRRQPVVGLWRWSNPGRDSSTDIHARLCAGPPRALLL
jgi:hypothetical protein